MQTVINIKTDKSLKEEAQKIAKELRLPLGTIINSYLREFVQEQRVVFSTHPKPNNKTQKLLDRILLDMENNKNVDGPFKSAKEAIAYLHS